jgi:hypothetical protein
VIIPPSPPPAAPPSPPPVKFFKPKPPPPPLAPAPPPSPPPVFRDPWPPYPPPSPPPLTPGQLNTPSPPPSPPPAVAYTPCTPKDLAINEVMGDSATGALAWIEIASTSKKATTCTMQQCTLFVYDCAAETCTTMSQGYSAAKHSFALAAKGRTMLAMDASVVGTRAAADVADGHQLKIKLCCEAGFKYDKRDAVDGGQCIDLSGIDAMGGALSWGRPRDSKKKDACAMRATPNGRNGGCQRVKD